MSELFSSSIGFPFESRVVVCGLLNSNLALLSDLYSQTKYAHWNVKGLQFISQHELFDKLAEELEEYIDNVAERITALGGIAEGTVRMTAKGSELPEFPYEAFEGKDVLTALGGRYSIVAISIREAISESAAQDDAATSDLFTEISRGLDKSLWFLEAHLQA